MLNRFGALRALIAVSVAGLACSSAARADEGMWLLNHPPTATLKSKYGFEPTPQWLEHVQKSAVRFSTGGSGSIISASGLVLTNHHVGSDMLAKLSTPERNLLNTGFHAKSNAEELKCPDLELLSLWSIEDVTKRVNDAAAGAASSADANTARRKAMTAIEAESQEKTGLFSQVVTLYQGGRYHLYQYRRYTDIRLVFAPEKEIAFFGGDTDNFEYPRFNLDMCLFRIYQDGKPLQAEHHLMWSAGSKEGDLALVIGHPGSTRRLFTVDHLKFLRDVDTPMSLRSLWRQEIKYTTFRARSEDNARVAEEDYFGVANGRKFLTGQLEGLQDPRLLAAKLEQEQRLRSAVAANPQWQQQWGGAWDDISKAETARREWYARWYVLGKGGSGGVGGSLFDHARTILRLADEKPKPSGDRLREYRDSNLDSVYLDLYSPAPIHDNLEIEKMASSLAWLGEVLGCDDPIVVAALGGKSPRDRAEELVKGCTLRDIETRKRLVAGGKDAVKASKDPMILLAAALDTEARALRTRFEDQVEAVERESYAKIAAAKFAIEGESAYPDATFTLRLAFGPIVGYQDAEESGGVVPAYTSFAGLWKRYEERKGQMDFDLPKSWLDHKNDLDPKTPFNFICTADIIGGNSGSPIVNTAGEVIGLIFDGNIHSLTAGLAYGNPKHRAVAVDSRAIIEAMKKVYGADVLVKEIVAR